MDRVTIIVNEGPGSLKCFNAVRLAAALVGEKMSVYMFLLHDGTYAALKDQNPIPGLGEMNMEKRLKELLEFGVTIECCSVCADARGILPEKIIDGIPIGSMVDLAKSIAQSKHVISM